jgi:hypothetical protein
LAHGVEAPSHLNFARRLLDAAAPLTAHSSEEARCA